MQTLNPIARIDATPCNYDQLARHIEFALDTGLFRWRILMAGRKPGWFAGTPDGGGHLRIMVSGRRYQAHRLAWLLSHGEDPKDQIDHINGDRADNRLFNLREATHQDNVWNTRWKPSKKGIPLGVSVGRHGEIKVRTRFKGYTLVLGLFVDVAEAERAYVEINAKLRGEFSAHRRSGPHGGDLADPDTSPSISASPSFIAEQEKSTDGSQVLVKFQTEIVNEHG